MVTLKQTKNGSYDSTPEMNDILSDLGYENIYSCICDEEHSGSNCFCQSCYGWHIIADRHGHGEYINNVRTCTNTVKEIMNNNFKAKVSVDIKEIIEYVISNAKWEIV